MGSDQGNFAEFTDLVLCLDPIARLSEEEQQQLLTSGAVIRLEDGGVLFQRGDNDPYAYWLIDGKLQLSDDEQPGAAIDGANPVALQPLSPVRPRQSTARATSDAVIFRLDQALLNDVLDRRLAGDRANLEVNELDDEDQVSATGDWMMRMLSSEVFRKLPAANIQQLFGCLGPVEYAAGDAVVKQGESGDFYYVIQHGRCSVTRAPDEGAQEIKLAELCAGDGFGEEALVSGQERNATVRMLTDGVLMRLAKADFDELIRKPIVTSIDRQAAEKIVANGGKWLDVRFPDEYRNDALPGSQNVPLSALRMKIQRLARQVSYVVYCDTGERSAAAAFLLAQHGFDAHYLAGGIGVTAGASATGARLSAVTSAKLRQRLASPGDRRGRTGGAASSAVTPIRPGLTQPQTADAGDSARLRAALEQAKKALTNSRAEAEQLKAEIGQTRDDATAQLEQRRLEAEQAMQLTADVKRKLLKEKTLVEAEFAKTARELEKLQKLKAATEQQLRNEQQQLEQRSLETEQRLSEALLLKREAEQARLNQQGSIEDSLRSTREQLEQEEARAKEAVTQIGVLREAVEAARVNAEEERKRKEARELELAKVKSDTQEHLAIKERELQDEFARHASELESIRQAKRESEERLQAERAALKAQSDAAQARLAALRQAEERARAKAKAAEVAATQAAARAEAERKAREIAESKAAAEQAKAQEVAQAVAIAQAEREAREAAEARAAAEQARARAAEEAKIKQAAEAAAIAQAEREAREAAEARAAAEHARARAAEEAKIKQAAEAAAIAQAERKAREEAEARAAAEEARARAAEEAQVKEAAQAAAIAQAERKAREAAETRAKAAEEEKVRKAVQAGEVAQAERQAREAAEMRAQAAEEARLLAESTARHEAETKLRELAEVREQAEREVQAKVAEEQARHEAEAQARAKLDAQLRANEDVRKLADSQAQAKAAAEREADARYQRYRDSLKRAMGEEQTRLRVQRQQLEAESARVRRVLSENEVGQTPTRVDAAAQRAPDADTADSAVARAMDVDGAVSAGTTPEMPGASRESGPADTAERIIETWLSSGEGEILDLGLDDMSVEDLEPEELESEGFAFERLPGLVEDEPEPVVSVVKTPDSDFRRQQWRMDSEEDRVLSPAQVASILRKRKEQSET